MFVDSVEVNLEAGNGGNGAVSFRHEKYVDHGGPDGGDGGHGGDIILLATRNENTLATFRYKKTLKAGDGQAGGKRRMHGRNGETLTVNVPIGTVITKEDGTLLADLVADGQGQVIANGGHGGFGNAHFVSSVRQAPRVAEKGEKGDILTVKLELKIIADVGLVGLPNAGKSTLLSVVSNARPAIADYPFTTLQPSLGVVDIDDTSSILMADIPGLIEGASKGKGLGDEFLRHIERTKVIIHLIDAYSQDLVGAYKTIQKELKDYKVDLSGRPQIVVLTKTEGLDDATIKELKEQIASVAPKKTQIMAISSQSGEGLDELKYSMQKIVNIDNAKKAKIEAEPALPVIGLRPTDDDWLIEQVKDDYVVTGKKIERFASRTNFGDFHGEQRLRDIMKKSGVTSELKRRGAEPGANIIIGDPKIGNLEY